MFTEKNIHQIESYGLTEAEVIRQIEIFRKGIPFANIVEAASADKGIRVLSEEEQEELVSKFENRKAELDLLKFVPASGAATRMFKFLHQFLENFSLEEDDMDSFLQRKENSDLKKFFSSMDEFPFSEMVFERLKKKYPDFDKFNKGKQNYLFVHEMLEETGLNFSHTPKGLVPFHKYKDSYITAFGEQLQEAAYYAAANGSANLHFTVSDDHEEKFKNRFQEIQDFIEEKTGIKFNISYSFQKKETDTVAATLDNDPFLDEDGSLIFRPAGHGALLDNLNEVDAHIIFIKNIDNVVSEKHVDAIAFHKKVLAGKLISLQETIFGLIEDLSSNKNSEESVKAALKFISEELKIADAPHNKEAILNVLNRPLRVCGVVENTGAPGGGPFLVKDEFGNSSYQIVEMSQIDLNNPHQKALVEKATHFNPVDLVCGVRNHRGEKYNLNDYADPNAGFISEKSHQGKPIKALERPGLWNGAMAKWNTVFVEVPLITFNPVKTVNDLLNDVHQGK